MWAPSEADEGIDETGVTIPIIVLGAVAGHHERTVRTDIDQLVAGRRHRGDPVGQMKQDDAHRIGEKPLIMFERQNRCAVMEKIAAAGLYDGEIGGGQKKLLIARAGAGDADQRNLAFDAVRDGHRQPCRCSLPAEEDVLPNLSIGQSVLEHVCHPVGLVLRGVGQGMFGGWVIFVRNDDVAIIGGTQRMLLGGMGLCCHSSHPNYGRR